MSAIPLNGSDSFGADLGSFEGSPWAPSGAGLPPVPGAPPPIPTVVTVAHDSVPLSSPNAPPLVTLRTPMPPAPPTAVDGRYSLSGPPLDTYGSLGDPGEAPAAPLPPAVPQENGHTLGLALILVGLGTAVGIKWLGGLYGGAAGGLYGGSAVNLIRAARAVTVGSPEADHEAVVSATYGVIGVGVASYILYQGRKERRDASFG